MREKRISFKGIEVFDFVIDDKYIWFVTAWTNYLFKMKIQEGLIVDAIRLPVGNPFSTDTVASMYMLHDNIYLIPNKENRHLICYEKKTGRAYVVISFEKNTFGNYSYQDKNNIYLTVRGKNIIIKYCKQNMEIEKMTVPINCKGLEGVLKIGDKFYFTEEETGNLICWDVYADEVWTNKKKPDKYKNANNHFTVSGMLQCEDYLYVFPEYSNMILRYDLNKDTVFCQEMFDEYLFDKPLFMCAGRAGDEYVAFMNGKDEWMIYGKDLKIKRFFGMSFSQDVIKALISESVFNNKGYMENTTNFYKEGDRRNLVFNYKLEDFIEDIVR